MKKYITIANFLDNHRNNIIETMTPGGYVTIPSNYDFEDLPAHAGVSDSTRLITWEELMNQVVEINKCKFSEEDKKWYLISDHLHESDITQCILDMSDHYIAKYKDINSTYDINNGLCEDFAGDVIDALGGENERITLLSCENFMVGDSGEDCGNGVWDVSLIETYWKNFKPTNGLTWEDMNRIPFVGSHVWIYFEGRNYDAQCSEGVENIFDLPMYRQYIQDCINENKN